MSDTLSTRQVSYQTSLMLKNVIRGVPHKARVEALSNVPLKPESSQVIAFFSVSRA